jgi:hypothetical protein
MNMTKRQRSKAAAALGRRGGLAWAKTRTPEELHVRAMKMVEARRAKARALVAETTEIAVGAVGQ